MKTSFRTFCISAGVSVALAFFYFIFFLNHVSPNEFGVAYNSNTGEIFEQDVGWHRTSPFVLVHYIPTTVINCSLGQGRVGGSSSSKVNVNRFVKFNRAKTKEFVATQGFQYWGFPNVLYGYVYSGKHFSFITDVTKEMETDVVSSK